MAERVTLHVGMPRAGTLYLQKLLLENRTALESAGVDLVVDTARALGRAANEIARGGGEHWRALVAAVHAAPGQVLLSWDGFSAVGPTGARRAVADLAPAQVQVICTVRDPVRLVPSMWRQQLRTGSTEGFADFVAGVRDGRHRDLVPDPVEVVDAWAGALPAEQIDIVVIPALPQAPLWPLFAAAADLAPGILDEPGLDESVPDVVALELLRQVNVALGEQLPTLNKRYVELLRPLFSRTNQEVVEFPAVLEGTDRAWAIEQGQRIARSLGERGFTVHGDLAHLVAAPTNAPAPTGAPALDLDAAVVPLAAHTIAGLLIALRKARNRNVVDANPSQALAAEADADGWSAADDHPA